jgi:hypothetical protein
MAQFIRIPTTFNEAYESGLQQVSQIIYRLSRAIEIFWHTGSQKVFVQDNGECFYLWSPDIPLLTLKHVIEGLGYSGDQIVVLWALDDLQNEVLSLSVCSAPLNQLALYAPGEPIPNEPPQGTFPATIPVISGSIESIEAANLLIIQIADQNN